MGSNNSSNQKGNSSKESSSVLAEKSKFLDYKDIVINIIFNF